MTHKLPHKEGDSLVPKSPVQQQGLQVSTVRKEVGMFLELPQSLIEHLSSGGEVNDFLQ